MTQQIIIIISVLVLSSIALSLLIFILLNKHLLGSNIVRNSIISICESVDKVGIPFITVHNNGEAYNMLLDSGSNISYVDSRYLEKFQVKDLNQTTNTVGAGGTNLSTRHYVVSFEFGGVKYKDMAGSIDLSASFDQIKKESGIDIHGIIGGSFFRYNHFVLDYDKMIFYKVKSKQRESSDSKKKQ